MKCYFKWQCLKRWHWMYMCVCACTWAFLISAPSWSIPCFSPHLSQCTICRTVEDQTRQSRSEESVNYYSCYYLTAKGFQGIQSSAKIQFFLSYFANSREAMKAQMLAKLKSIRNKSTLYVFIPRCVACSSFSCRRFSINWALSPTVGSLTLAFTCLP